LPHKTNVEVAKYLIIIFLGRFAGGGSSSWAEALLYGKLPSRADVNPVG